MKTLRAVAVGLFAFLIYLVFSGFGGRFDLITGAVVGAVCGILFGADLVQSPSKALNPVRWIKFLCYLVKYMTVIELKAHLGVIRSILTGRINPGIVRVHIANRSDYGKVLVANSITNTPGTVVVDIDEGKNILYVHKLNITTLEHDKYKEEICGEFERAGISIFE